MNEQHISERIHAHIHEELNENTCLGLSVYSEGSVLMKKKIKNRESN